MRRFLIKTLIYALPIIVPILIFRIFILSHIPNGLSGDLSRLGYIPFADDYNIPSPAFEKEPKIDMQDVWLSDRDSSIFIFGDSFSQQQNGYAFYLSNYTDKDVYAFTTITGNPFANFLSYTHQLPSIVIIETVERVLIHRLKEVDYASLATKDDSVRNVGVSSEDKTSKMTILQHTQLWIKRKLGLSGYGSPVNNAILEKKLFSCKAKEDKLYFYKSDINTYSQSDIDLAALKLDSLFAYADSLNINLYVLIAEDKYDLYQSYIVDNQYPKQDVLEKLIPVCQRPQIINSKDTLSQMATAGVKDIYWCHDTHWSPIGAKAVAVQLINSIHQQQ